MDLDGAFAHEQPRSDFLVAQARGDEPDDLELAARQIEGELARGDFATQQLLQEASDRALLDPGLAAVHLADALEQHRRGHLFQDDAAHAEANGLADLIFLQRRAEQHDASRKILALELADHRQAVLPGEPEVQDEDVGAVRAHRPHRVLAVGAAREHGELLATEELLETVERDGMAICEHEPDGLSGGHRVGVGQHERHSTSRSVAAFVTAMLRSPSIDSKGPNGAASLHCSDTRLEIRFGRYEPTARSATPRRDSGLTKQYCAVERDGGVPFRPVL